MYIYIYIYNGNKRGFFSFQVLSSYIIFNFVGPINLDTLNFIRSYFSISYFASLSGCISIQLNPG